MKLDTRHLRYLSTEDWRVLTAVDEVEMGSKNHEIVPTPLIIQLSNLRGGSGVHKCISTLAKVNLISRTQNMKYDGYRLTYGGLDYLALHTHMKRSNLFSTGPCVGAGKESDIYICAPPSSSTSSSQSTQDTKEDKDTQVILKIHRLGRISFRTIKINRDYLRHRTSASWMYMSRLAAQKEFAFMQILAANGFKVPDPIAWSRHTVVMSLVEGTPLRAVKEVPDPAALYAELIEIILRFAHFGLIHGDFNEFNIMLLEDTTPVVIDFPQVLSTSHANAEYYFKRDVQCIKTFFERRFHFKSSEPGPFFKDAIDTARRKGMKRLDVEVEASGFSKKMGKDLQKYIEQLDAEKDTEEGSDEDDEDNEDDDDGDDNDEEAREAEGGVDEERKRDAENTGVTSSRPRVSTDLDISSERPTAMISDMLEHKVGVVES